MASVFRLLLLLCAAAIAVFGQGTFSKCDVNQDGSTNVTDVQSLVREALGVVAPTHDINSDGVVNLVDLQAVIDAALSLGCLNAPPPLSVTGFSPATGAAGTLITVTGNGFGSNPQITMLKQGGGTIVQPLSSATNTSLSFVLAAGTATGPITVSSSGSNATSASSFTITASSSFSLAATPPSANLISGQSVSYAISLNSGNGFTQLAALSVTGVPVNITSTLTPSSIAAGQTALLTLTAPPGQSPGSINLTIAANATVEGVAVSQSLPVTLAIVAPTTSFIGRTVVSDTVETPLAGITVSTLGLDGAGNATGCTNHAVVSDAAGNFALTNLPASCIGPQLIGFNGNTATSPAGKYAGVDLVFTLVSGQVVVSPVLVHMPRIDTAETFMVQQNAAADQTYVFQSIPGLSVTVYAGTTFTNADGTKPNPFPLTAIDVPVDRLPDQMPLTNSMVTAFIVAFQPANTVASKAVAVYFPNTLNNPPGTNVPLMTLDPTRGRMVAYGTGTVSNDGTTVIPDIDPATGALNHRYGIVHFDWHGPAALLASLFKLICGCLSIAGEPVDLGSGVNVMTSTDLIMRGNRGSISIERTYRTLSGQLRAFGIGSSFNYDFRLDTQSPQDDAVVNVEFPNGTLIPFARQADGTLLNKTVPAVAGAVLTTADDGTAKLRFKDGTYFTFTPGFALAKSVLTSIGDPNGNITKIVRSVSDPRIITEIDDPVGRKLVFTWNSSPVITSITDPVGRAVYYTYNANDTLATFTNVLGGITHYTYDAQNRILTVTDPRGVMTESNIYDSNGRVAKQVNSAGGTLKFVSQAGDPIAFGYVLTNALVASSPVTQATLQDPLGNVTVYRFNTQGYLTGVTDATGQTRNINRAAGTNLVLSMTGNGKCLICGDPAAGDVSFTYDANGNLLTRTDALNHTTAYTWDPVFNNLTSVTDPLGNTYHFVYDGHGNATKITDPKGHDTVLTRDGNGLVTSIKNTLGNLTNLTYDALIGDVAMITNAVNQKTQFSYDATSRLSTVLDGLSQSSTVTYNASGEPTAIQEGNGRSTRISYDSAGFMTAVTDPNGHTTQFGYDAAGRLASKKDPLNRSTTYQYDANGNLTSFTNRRGQTINYSYDTLNRLVMETYPDASVKRSYDAAGRLVHVVDSQSGTFDMTYNGVGQLLKQIGPTGTITYTRDANGRVLSRQVSGQQAASYTYDPNGNLTGASLGSASVTMTYDSENHVISTVRSNGVTGTYGYDAADRLTSISEQKNGSTLFSRSLKYGPAGDITSNSLDQGIALATASTAGSFDAASELTAFGGTTYTNDASGNRLTETNATGTTSYSWDARGRLQKIVTPAGITTTFLYDFNGNMFEKQVTGANLNTKQDYVLDDNANIVSMSDDGTIWSILDGRAKDDIIAIAQGGAVLFPLSDQVSSQAAFADENGAVVGRQFFEPFGTSSGAGTVSIFQFTGRPQVNSGLYYYRARFYDSNTGRFLSEDPSGLDGGDSNFYRYVTNDPARFSDPDGRKISWSSWKNILRTVGKHIGKDQFKGFLKCLVVDTVADLAAEETGKPWVADAIKDTEEAVELGETALEIGGLVALAVATTGPVVLTATVLFLGYESFELGYHSAELGDHLRKLYNEIEGPSKAVHQ